VPGTSGRAAGSGRAGADRRRPEAAPGGGAGAAALERAKQQVKFFMFVGSGVLLLLLIVLLIIRGPEIFGSSPQPIPAETIKDDLKIDEIKELRAKAARQFAAAKKMEGAKERNAQIRKALETLAEAQEKLQALSELPKYKGEEYDQVFEPIQAGMSQDMKTYRDAIRPGGE
jgi:Tfp pilus assembly protein PilN